MAVKGEFGEVSPYACFSLFPRPPILTTVSRKTQNQMDLWTILMFPSYTQGQHEQSDMQKMIHLPNLRKPTGTVRAELSAS